MQIEKSDTTGLLVVTGYKPGGFFINREWLEGSALLLPQAAQNWLVTDVTAMTLADVQPVLDLADELEVFLLGCGQTTNFPPQEVREALQQAGIGLEVMDSPAACRTHAVLVQDGRRVVTALVAL